MLVHGFFFFYCWPSVIALFPFQSPGTWMVQTWATQHSGWEWLWARLWLQFWVLLSTELLPDWNNWQAGKAFPPQPDAPSIKTKPLWPDAEPPQLELDKVHVILLFFLIPWRLPGHFPYLCHFHHLISSPLWSQLITSHQQQADDRIIPHAAGPSFFRLTLFVQAK